MSPECQPFEIWIFLFYKNVLVYKDFPFVCYIFKKFISQITELVPATRCAVFCYTISARVIRGLALLGTAITFRGVWAHIDLNEKISSKVGPVRFWSLSSPGQRTRPGRPKRLKMAKNGLKN